jgi:hypothetical protein
MFRIFRASKRGPNKEYAHMNTIAEPGYMTSVYTTFRIQRQICCGTN